MLKKAAQKGFTIVELLIVIVVIGILAALVLNTFAGVQQRARDTERQTDVKAISSQLEAFYADEGYYPTFTQLGDAAWRTTNMPGVDEGAFIAPQQDADSLAGAASTDKSVYGYVPAGCDATTSDNCQTFTLTYTKEGDDKETVTVNSLN